MSDSANNQPTATFVHVPWKVATEAHVDGCKAITRRYRGMTPRVGSTGVTVAIIEEMQANPDEGFLVIHECLKAYGVKQWKESARYSEDV